MNDSYLHFTAGRLQAAEIDRRAQRLGPQLAALSDRAQIPLRDPVTVRFAAPDDQRELKRLADYDGLLRRRDRLPALPGPARKAYAPRELKLAEDAFEPLFINGRLAPENARDKHIAPRQPQRSGREPQRLSYLAQQ